MRAVLLAVALLVSCAAPPVPPPPVLVEKCPPPPARPAPPPRLRTLEQYGAWANKTEIARQLTRDALVECSAKLNRLNGAAAQ